MTDAAVEPQEHVAQLRAGRTVTVRAVRPDDRHAFAVAFERLSPHSRYTRYFRPLRELSPRMLDEVANPPADCVMALAAFADAPQQDGTERPIVGAARILWAPGSHTCEFAVTIADDWQGAGLARHLIQTLITLARARGMQRMEGFVLPGNDGMRGLAHRLGFSDAPFPEDPGLRLVSLDLK
ncbi:GNAT family N-acetyltransferase [Variovorax sp. J22R133]|uniref:GNAT family N-acetyltransferase n=1 Tax=Variovorax brevis TaxID=3053503 RepID=UPI002575A6CF|nr:GNAT family N-acetyltransferase [Variovorax sp. J22R133]MDM0110688.1 GNAT family N-acetyltransferase [Variovorax sp. J22R133]